MRKILRLFVTQYITDEYPIGKKCDIDITRIPVIETFEGFDEIVICGGEPLLYHRNIERLCQSLWMLSDITEHPVKIIVETSKPDYYLFDSLRKWVDGFILTPRTKTDMVYFKKLNNELLHNRYFFKDISLKLNILPSVRDFYPENLNMWKIEEFNNDGIAHFSDDFRRLRVLWDSDFSWYNARR